MRATMLPIALLGLSAATVPNPSCPAIAAFKAQDTIAAREHGKTVRRSVARQVYRLPGVLFYGSQLRVDLDGAANAYRYDNGGGAIDSICNGAAVTPATGPLKGLRVAARQPKRIGSRDVSGVERCRTIRELVMKSHDAGYAPIPEGTIDWYALAKDGRRPCVQKATDPYPGFFVAQTAIPADARAGAECDPTHWLNAIAIPYIVRQPTINFPRKRTLALITRKLNGKLVSVVAVVGDSGNAADLGEGSAALHWALGHGNPTTIPSTLDETVATFLFPDVMATYPITAASLQARRDDLVRRVGGQARLEACSATAS